MPVRDALQARLLNQTARGARSQQRRSQASDVVQRRVFQKTELFPDAQFFGAQRGGVDMRLPLNDCPILTLGAATGASYLAYDGRLGFGGLPPGGVTSTPLAPHACQWQPSSRRRSLAGQSPIALDDAAHDPMRKWRPFHRRNRRERSNRRGPGLSEAFSLSAERAGRRHQVYLAPNAPQTPLCFSFSKQHRPRIHSRHWRRQETLARSVPSGRRQAPAW